MDICDTFDFSNLINSKTWHKSNGGSSLDVLLTNHPKYINPKKSTGPDKIPPTLLKIAADILDTRLSEIITTL